jgi:hypothetical protein
MSRSVLVGGLMTFAVVALAGCGGSSKAAQGGGGEGLGEAPEWVNRGSRVEKGSIFGVGSVQGVANTPLARDTAANRGRAEISRILEVYSASLMKDYSASTTAGDMSASSEEQRVEQAIKTFSANLMKGTETKDFYLAPNGTWFCLVELNFERSREVAAVGAQMGPGMKKWVDENGDDVLNGLETETGKINPPPPPAAEPPPSGQASAPPPSPPPPAAPPPPAPPPGPPAKVGGPAPAWTQGTCDRSKYLCGVGDGPNRTAADNNARANLAKIFTASIQSVATSFQGYAQKITSATGESWTEVQKVSEFSMVSTNKVLTMSEILEGWSDGKGKEWSLAVIDKAKASGVLRERIQSLDGLVDAKLSAAMGTEDKLARLKNARAAATALAEREALNSDLQVISGSGIPAPHTMAEVLGLFEQAAGDLSMGIALSGAGAERVRACLEEALTAKGYQIQANVDEESEDEVNVAGSYDVLIKGNVKNASRGKIAGGEVVETTVTLKLINGKTNKILQTVTGSEKGTRPTVKAAADTSAFKICQKKVPSMVQSIDRYFGK